MAVAGYVVPEMLLSRWYFLSSQGKSLSLSVCGYLPEPQRDTDDFLSVVTDSGEAHWAGKNLGPEETLLTLWALDGQGTEIEDFHAGAHFCLCCSLAISRIVRYFSHSSIFLYFRWHFAYGQSAWQSWKKEPHSLLTKWMTRYCENPFW